MVKKHEEFEEHEKKKRKGKSNKHQKKNFIRTFLRILRLRDRVTTYITECYFGCCCWLEVREWEEISEEDKVRVDDREKVETKSSSYAL